MSNFDRFNTETNFQTIEELGIIVKKLRKKDKQTQQHLADMVGVGKRFVSELERGKKTLEVDKVFKVASYAGIKLMCSYRH